jgi:hypothetical protein
VLSREATNTNFIVFGLTRSWLELTIYRTQGEHANHYTTDAVGSRIQFNDIIGRWKARRSMSKGKPKTIYETLVLTNIELYPYIATILLTLLTMHASTATAEQSFLQ